METYGKPELCFSLPFPFAFSPADIKAVDFIHQTFPPGSPTQVSCKSSFLFIIVFPSWKWKEHQVLLRWPQWKPTLPWVCAAAGDFFFLTFMALGIWVGICCSSLHSGVVDMPRDILLQVLGNQHDSHKQSIASTIRFNRDYLASKFIGPVRPIIPES